MAADHARLYPDDLAGQLAIRHTIAERTLGTGGDAGHAIGVYSALVRQCATAFGVSHPWTLHAEHALARLQVLSGNRGRSEQTLRTLANRFRAILGPRHVSTLDVRLDWLLALADSGQVEAATSGLRDLTADCRRTLGDRNPTTLAAGRALAHCLGLAGQYPEATTLLETVLGNEHVVFGQHHPQVFRTRRQLADLRGRHDPVRAYRELRVLLQEQTRRLGSHHRDVETTRISRDAWERLCMIRIARQSIYDLDGTVFGYELLFRDANGAVSASRRDASATSQVMVNAFTDLAISEVVGRHRCFLNVTREFLVGTLPFPLAPERVVLELLDAVDLDEEVVQGIRRLRDSGFQIALDGTGWGRSHVGLLPTCPMSNWISDRPTCRRPRPSPR